MRTYLFRLARSSKFEDLNLKFRHNELDTSAADTVSSCGYCYYATITLEKAARTVTQWVRYVQFARAPEFYSDKVFVRRGRIK